ncbi:cell wall hydrolase [Roseibium sp.]|uniref:cell wall hydrolase n=1 Tax=Roseibium sp. TaxID=1936156 RepID=UPI003B5142E0
MTKSFIVQSQCLMRADKDDPATANNLVSADTYVVDTENPGSDNFWTEVIFFPGDPGDQKGWVPTEKLIEAKGFPPRLDLDVRTLVSECVSKAWTTNLYPETAPFFADPDYLIALASIQSNLKNPEGEGPGKQRNGTFGITAQEWAAFVAACPGGIEYFPRDIDSPISQVAGAAYQMHRDAKELSSKAQAEGIGDDENPYIPRFGELLRCRLIGVDATHQMQNKLKGGAGSQSLRDFLIGTGMSTQDADALMTDRKRFMRTDGTNEGVPYTLKQFHDKCSQVLNAEFKTAFKLIKQHRPEAISEASGSAPWMEFAEKELADKVSENTPQGRTRIAEYFDATGFSQGTADDPWCAAFVSWCMSKCPPEIAKTYHPFKNVAAGSANWRNWGNTQINPKGDPPKGAVVVLSPSKNTDAISHVGFFIEYLDEKRLVAILGGNQSNEVNVTNFKAADVVGIRWLQSDDGGGAAAGPGVGEHSAKDLITLARTIYGEARGLDGEGRQAVANVMMNRFGKKYRGKTTVADVCLDPFQFSCWNHDDPNRPKIIAIEAGANTAFDECLEVARQALAGSLADLTQGALHYYSHKAMPSPPHWVKNSPEAKVTLKGDDHVFYVGIR